MKNRPDRNQISTRPRTPGKAAEAPKGQSGPKRPGMKGPSPRPKTGTDRPAREGDREPRRDGTSFGASGSPDKRRGPPKRRDDRRNRPGKGRKPREADWREQTGETDKFGHPRRADKPAREDRSAAPDRPARSDRPGKPVTPVKRGQEQWPGQPNRPANREQPPRPAPKKRRDEDSSEAPPRRNPRFAPTEQAPRAKPDRQGRPTGQPTAKEPRGRDERKVRPERGGSGWYETNESRPSLKQRQEGAWYAPDGQTPGSKAPSGPRPEEKAGDGREEPSEDGPIWILGRHEVMAALTTATPLEAVLMADSAHGPGFDELRRLVKETGVKVQVLPAETFRRRFGSRAQGIAARQGCFTYAPLEALIAAATKPTGLLVALNQVEDPRNLGAIVRTVEAAGGQGVIIPRHRSAGMTEGALATAQGAASWLPVSRVGNLGTTLEQLKKAGFWVIGLDAEAPTWYSAARYRGPLVIVAGGEDVGLGTRIREVCDEIVSIPLTGHTPSLNVAVSTGVVLFEILRQYRSLAEAGK
jgi:23S rRNA (guanosine2251-2'-O)-methyltransferase